MKACLIAILLMLSLIASACGTVAEAPVQADTDPTPDTARIQHGIEVYRSQYCGMCHTLSAANTRGTFGPAHDTEGAIAAERILATNYTGTATTAEAYIRESIVDPGVYIAADFTLSSHQMPSFAHLPTEDIDAMVYMLLHQVQE